MLHANIFLPAIMCSGKCDSKHGRLCRHGQKRSFLNIVPNKIYDGFAIIT